MSDRVSKCYFCGAEVKTGSTVYHIKEVSPTFTAIQCDDCYEKDVGLQDSKAILLKYTDLEILLDWLYFVKPGTPNSEVKRTVYNEIVPKLEEADNAVY